MTDVRLLRTWLERLSDDEVLAVADVIPALRVGRPGDALLSGRAGRRRAVPKLRRHLRSASDEQLVEYTRVTLRGARQDLLGKGYAGDQLHHPDHTALRRMLLDLPGVLARLALFGLLLGDTAASATAKRHSADLLALLDLPELTNGSAPADTAGPTTGQGDPRLDRTAVTVAAHDWATMLAAADRLEERSVALATRLRADADSVESGRLPTDASHTAALLTRFADDVDALLVAVRETDPSAGGVDSLVDVRAAADRAERRASEEHERRRLLDERAQLEQMLENSSVAMRATYRSALDEVVARLAGFGPLPQAVADAAEPVAPEPVAAEPVAPEPQAVPTVVPESAAPTSAGPDPVAPTTTAPEPVPVRPVAPRTAAPQPRHAAPEPVTPEPVIPEPVIPEPVIPEPVTPEPVTPEVHEPATPAPVAARLADAIPPDPTADEPPDEEGAERLAFPWDAGSPPLAVELVGDGRLAEAYWVTAAADETTLRVDVLRLARAAFAATTAAGAGEVLMRFDVGAAHDRESVLVEAAALLRCGLMAGWSHRIPQLESAGVVLPTEWQHLAAAASDAVRQQCRIDASTSRTAEDPETTRVELGRAARKLRDELPNRSNTYQRATRVQQRMLRHDQPLGALLDLVVEWADGERDAAELRARLEPLSERDAADELIDRADEAIRSSSQKGRIIADARVSLTRTIAQVVDRAHEAVALAAQISAPDDATAPVRREVRAAAAAALKAGVPGGVGGAALGLLAHWIEEPDRPPWGTTPADGGEPDHADPTHAVPRDVLLVLHDLPRHADRRPDVTHPDARRALARLVDRPDPVAAFRHYCAVGALDLAEQLLRDQTTPEDENRLLAAQRHWREAVAVSRRDAEALLDRLRIQNLVEPAALAPLSGPLAAAVPDGFAAYDLVDGALRDLRATLQEQLQDRVDRLREETRTDVHDAEVRARIEALLDEHDTVTANEFLAIHRSGAKIPAGTDEPVAPLRAFLAAADTGTAGVDAAAWADAFRTAETDELPSAVRDWLSAWDELGRARDARLRPAVDRVLRLIGLDPIPGGIDRMPLQRATVHGFDVRAVPRDRSFIAELGSQAHNRYRVLVVQDERRGRSPLDDVDPTTDTPYLVLYLHPMTRAQRAGVADDARSRKVHVLVIDPPVVGWVAARAPSSFRATQQLTLPFSSFQPYQPFVAGLVPAELFVGREDERREILAPGGGLFVYGGRQLGKSALLHSIEKAPADDTRIAVYLDLKSLGIGEAEKPERLWSELAAPLKGKGVFSAKVSARPTADVVVREIRRWLEADESRRLLVLADEADAFLTADSQGVSTPGGMQYFPNMSRLKELMESTGRRFKVVFAGLHQVQRFSHLPNVPTPHGGPDILIGPLDPHAARALVVEPLAALGYTFERPELVWRLLAATNYQPAAIQIFCRALLMQLRQAYSGADVPVVIRSDDIERTSASRDVREPIAERMRITINLEDRYRVLALLIARKSLDDGFTRSYGTAELLTEAADIWPGGFDPSFDDAKLTVYLEEMQGLGLLARQADERTWAVRSPNVVSLLGTRDELHRELDGSDFILPYEYNPWLSRRLLERDSRSGRERRSPLSDAALQRLVDAVPAVVPLIAGTEALAVGRVPDALRAYLEADGKSVVRCGTADLKQHLAEAARERNRWVVVDLRGTAPAIYDEAIDQAVRSKTVPVVVLVDADQALRSEESDPGGGTGPIEIVALSRWTAESIRSWHDCPFHTPELRHRLIRVTGGWPDVVETAVHQAQQPGSTTESTLRRLEKDFPGTAEQAAALLARAGVDDALARTLWPWVELTEPGEVLPVGDLPGVLDIDTAAAAAVEHRLRVLGVLTDRHDGISLDELTHRCLTTVRPC